MIVVVRLDERKLEVYELVEEKPRTYKVKRIELLKWANQGFNRVINKDECIYKGEILDVAEIIDQWNTESDNRETAINIADAKFKLHTDILKDTLSKKSL